MARVRSQSELEAVAPDLARLVLGIIPDWDPWPLQPEGAYFDTEEAYFALAWIPRWCRLVKGPYAGQPFHLIDCQAAVVASAWGFRLADGRRRFRRVWYYLAKKNAKSSFAAALILLVMATDAEEGAEIYSVASSQKQAGHVFDHAAGMVKKQPALKSRLRVLGDKGGTVQKSISDPASMSFYRVLCSDAGTEDGFNPHLNVIDEVHRHRSPDMADLLVRSASARRQPLTIYMTTADYARESACNSLLAYAKHVRANGGDPAAVGYDPAFLPCIWEATMQDDWGSEGTWRKANPGLGTIKSLEAMQEAWREAKDQPSLLAKFLRFDLNIVVDAEEAWLRREQWDACNKRPLGESAEAWRVRMLQVLKGRPCIGALDLGRSTDLTAFALWFPEEQVVLVWYWIPRETAREAEDRDRVPYADWIRNGWIEATEGNVCDYDHVEKRLEQLCQDFKVLEIAYDDWYAADVANRLQTARIQVVSFPQGYKSMSKPSYELERMLAGKLFDHGGQPVLRWNALSAMVERDPAGNIKPSKRKSTQRIDGLVAFVMALGRAIIQPEPSRSVYETRGPRVFG